MLRLDLRSAKLNQDHKGKALEKDGVVTKLLTFGLEDIPVDQHEIGVLTGEPHAYAALYNTRTDQVPEPFLKCFKALEFDGQISGAYLKVRLFGGREFEFSDVKVTKTKLALAVGGVSLMSCKVTVIPALNASYAELIDQFGQSCEIELRGDLPTDQQDLPLGNKFGEGEQPEQGAGKGRGRKGKGRSQPRAH
jgi:hypothetical protein